jgi:hypothetical protein
MRTISGAATVYLLNLLSPPAGVDVRARELASEDGVDRVSAVRTIAIQNAASDLAERTLQGKYPAVLVYCDRLTNTLKEKFRVFSGTARLCVEVRCSQDRLEDLDQQLQLYTGAVCRILEDGRGDWKQGLYYAGGYEVTYGPVRTGGNHFLQTAKVVLEVEVSR